MSRIEERVKEAKKLGFTRAVIPKKNIGGWTAPKGIEIVGVDTISDALKAMFKDDLKF